MGSFLVAGSDDLADEIGHVHLNVELEEIDQWMELDVDKAVG